LTCSDDVLGKSRVNCALRRAIVWPMRRPSRPRGRANCAEITRSPCHPRAGPVVRTGHVDVTGLGICSAVWAARVGRNPDRRVDA
jgi:hypothetical protein